MQAGAGRQQADGGGSGGGGRWKEKLHSPVVVAAACHRHSAHSLSSLSHPPMLAAPLTDHASS